MNLSKNVDLTRVILRFLETWRWNSSHGVFQFSAVHERQVLDDLGVISVFLGEHLGPLRSLTVRSK